MKRRKYILIGAAVAAIAAAGTFGTYAYLTDMGQLNNEFTIGRNNIDIEENYNPPSELTEGDNIFTKEVQIENTGNVDCYVRVFADFSDSAVKENAFLSPEVLTEPDDTRWVKATEYRDFLAENKDKYHWVYIPLSEDPLLGGYYYYDIPLKPGELTAYLIRSVNANFKDAKAVQDFDIIISAESVQVLDKDGNEFPSWQECWTEFMGRR
ncbi:MAG: hypothetical protein J1G06_01700 [Oscillospiraceae bacterium]|nr:hypothetical protein [Oscillospiraceae bacterium]